MSNTARTTPQVLCLSSVNDVMRRESLRCDEESGGILLGCRGPGGSLLITHATPPGPDAVHGPYSFVHDVKYQNKALQGLFRKYNVDRIGAWHRHLKEFCVPSEQDRRTALRILQDAGKALPSFFCAITTFDLRNGFRVYPFYIQNGWSEFQPLVWEEISLGLDDDIGFSQDPIELISASVGFWRARHMSEPDASIFSAKEADMPGDEKLKSDLTWPGFNRPFPIRKQKEGEPQTKSSYREKTISLFCPWYWMKQGRQRLQQEQAILKQCELEVELLRTEADGLVFSLPRPHGRRIEVVCDDLHPYKPPRLFLQYCRDVVRECPNVPWSADMWLAQLFIPLLGPDIDAYVSCDRGLRLFSTCMVRIQPWDLFEKRGDSPSVGEAPMDCFGNRRGRVFVDNRGTIVEGARPEAADESAGPFQGPACFRQKEEGAAGPHEPAP